MRPLLLGSLHRTIVQSSKEHVESNLQRGWVYGGEVRVAFTVGSVMLPGWLALSGWRKVNAAAGCSDRVEPGLYVIGSTWLNIRKNLCTVAICQTPRPGDRLMMLDTARAQGGSHPHACACLFRSSIAEQVRIVSTLTRLSPLLHETPVLCVASIRRVGFPCTHLA